MQLDYEAAVEYLTRNPGEIYRAWCLPRSHIAGRLFSYARMNNENRPDGLHCGCLTMIRSGSGVGWTDAITDAVRADDRLPRLSVGFIGWNTSVFAEWQTYLDCAIRGKDPAGIEFSPIVLDLVRKAGGWLPPQEPVKRELPKVVLDCVNWTLVFDSREVQKVSAD